MDCKARPGMVLFAAAEAVSAARDAVFQGQSGLVLLPRPRGAYHLSGISFVRVYANCKTVMNSPLQSHRP